MKNKIIFCICLILVAVTCASVVPVSSYSYDIPVPTSSAAAMLVNVDTGTIVYEKNIDAARYMSYLSHIMTFIVVHNNVADIDTKTVEIKQSVLDKVEIRDNTLTKYVGKKMSVKNLLYFLMLQSGTDAAYVLADYVTNGDIPKFVDLMNQKATSLGCTKTNFISPAMSTSRKQYSTCRDMYKIMQCAQQIDDFKIISGTYDYNLSKNDPDNNIKTNEKEKDIYIYNKNSLLKPSSPYYFKYVINGKSGYNAVAGTNVAVYSVYRNITYVFISFGSNSGNEQNAFTEAKQFITWAYLNLKNDQIVSSSHVLKTISSSAVWGNTDIPLTAREDIYRTLPKDYDAQKLTLKFDIPDSVKLPIFERQNLGTAKIYYDGKYFDEIDLISNKSIGVGMLDDVGSLISFVYGKTIPESVTATESLEEQSEPTSQPVTSDESLKKETKETVAASATTSQAGD